MKFKYSNAILLFIIILGCSSSSPKEVTSKKKPVGIVIHGGAGTILRENMTNEIEDAYRKALAEAVKIGYNILKNGGSGQEAVEKTINAMEDSALFNAGKGAVLTAKETIELELDAISKMQERIGDSFVNAIQLILASKGRLIVAGIGKSANIANKMISINSN